ncbi:hydrogenase nickel incorporation protein HypB [Pseudomonas fluorescens]|uniref:Hydrogenase maturation factor HypB n=1 Tax=Pseudomonas fluorescens TaxID=294 RepID=A0A5E7ASR1_PSEFL|nr:hydrogenase nickel incorporation protein HypB [Pseudomonas fluorescens]VVN81150.1 Hydrogenase maturation factor HypB [Pseudomonas fluorescens]
MCTTCGCSDGAGARITDLTGSKLQRVTEQQLQGLPMRRRQHEPAHSHAQVHGTTLNLEQEILAKNNRLAELNRQWLKDRNILLLNLMSSPGAGKTTLLEHTLRDLAGDLSISVVEGDQETLFDAERIRATGCPAVQVNTGTGCHLEAGMLAGALKQLAPAANSLVMVENVGNLVCPALFDLGERAKVVILSVTEGADKPLKYPHMFRASSLMIISKIDLLPYVDFDLDACIAFARRINPDIEVLPLSATRGEGLPHWYAWLRGQLFSAV